MSRVDLNEIVEAVVQYRVEHPEPLTIQSLLNEVQAKFEYRPPRTAFKDAIRAMMPDADRWITDLETNPIVGDANDLLEKWVVNSVDRPNLRLDLERLIAKEAPESQVTQVARALDAVEGEPDWDSIKPESLRRELREAVVHAAIDAGHLRWAVDALCLTSAPPPKSCRDRLALVDQAVLRPILEDRLVSWPLRAQSEPVYSEAMSRLLTLAAASKGSAIVRAAFTGLAGVGDARPLPKWAANLAAIAVSEPEALGDVIELSDEPMVARVVSTTSGLSGGMGSPRIEVLKQVARSRHSGLLNARPPWRGLSVDVIGDLVSSAEVGDQILAASQPTIAEIVDREASSSPVWRVLMLAGRWPRLAPFVQVDRLRAALDRSDQSAVLARALIADVEERARVAAEELDAELAKSQREIEAGAAALAAARRRAEELSHTEAELRGLLADQAASKTSAFDAEINQGRIDALRLLVDLAERIRALSGLSDSSSEAVDTVLRDLWFELDRMGIRIEGLPGETRASSAELDASYHPGLMVEVITPAYLLPPMVTPLRSAFVRVIEGS